MIPQDDVISIICVDKHMVSSATWNKRARVNFFPKTNKIARARRACAICGL